MIDEVSNTYGGDEEGEVKVTVKGSGAGVERLKEVMRKEGAKAVNGAIAVFVAELKAQAGQ